MPRARSIASKARPGRGDTGRAVTCEIRGVFRELSPCDESEPTDCRANPVFVVSGKGGPHDPCFSCLFQNRRTTCVAF